MSGLDRHAREDNPAATAMTVLMLIAGLRSPAPKVTMTPFGGDARAQTRSLMNAPGT
jgi:hypothetical protein